MSTKKNQNAPTLSLPVYADSLKQAVGLLKAAGIDGITLDDLKRLKAAGCRAFRSTRVYLRELLPELADAHRPPADERAACEHLADLFLQLDVSFAHVGRFDYASRPHPFGEGPDLTADEAARIEAFRAGLKWGPLLLGGWKEIVARLFADDEAE
jgi:hypothetical protein